MSDAVGWGFGICFATNETATRDEAIAYLNNLKPVIQGYLETPVIKTVDLTVVNQGGETTQLKPIEGTMHIETSAASIKPIFEAEIPVEAITQNLASFIKE